MSFCSHGIPLATNDHNTNTTVVQELLQLRAGSFICLAAIKDVRNAS